ncbi:MAG TPA: SPOR domain-containing protein [Bryobacteraceae bacterium]|nr:SPOR domain-containing protein [Bryobacteraceae bacterium]
MAKSDEGEFELILGNRQLISVFLIVVVLLGVFFSMGYIVGRNSAAPAAEAAHNGGKTVAVEPPSAESEPPSSSPAAQEPPASPQESKPAETKHAETKPAASGPPTTHAEQPPPPAPVKPAPVAAAKPKPSAVGPASSGLASITNEPAPGQYWQVVATSRPGAEIISETLTKRGFHTLLTPASKEGFFRVLVGPFPDSGTQAEARTKLEAAGFKNPITKRY